MIILGNEFLFKVAIESTSPLHNISSKSTFMHNGSQTKKFKQHTYINNPKKIKTQNNNKDPKYKLKTKKNHKNPK